MEQFCVEFLERLHDLHEDFIETFEGLPAEALDWVPGEEMNSLCVLVVHTTGSGHWWIGIALGDPPERNRDAEFLAKGLSVDQLNERFAAVEAYARSGLAGFSLDRLAVEYPVPNRDMRITAAWGLLHMLEHTGIHLGHAQITRQLWERR